jgi:hypothetical protein
MNKTLFNVNAKNKNNDFNQHLQFLKEQKEIKQNLLNKCFITIEMNKDGNCMFKALSYILDETTDYHKTIREFLCINGKKITETTIGKGHIKEYMNLIMQDEMYGTINEIKVASILYEFCILIYDIETDKWNTDYYSKFIIDINKIKFLKYDSTSQHYDVLIPTANFNKILKQSLGLLFNKQITMEQILGQFNFS